MRAKGLKSMIRRTIIWIRYQDNFNRNKNAKADNVLKTRNYSLWFFNSKNRQRVNSTLHWCTPIQYRNSVFILRRRTTNGNMAHKNAARFLEIRRTSILFCKICVRKKRKIRFEWKTERFAVCVSVVLRYSMNREYMFNYILNNHISHVSFIKTYFLFSESMQH